MKYEVRKRNSDRKTWSTYAWTDVAENAFRIRDSLNYVTNEEFAVFTDEREINNVREAMII